jgi:hypothetical protein
MKWERIVRETGLVEHVCEHGVGHPDADSAIHVAKIMNMTYPGRGHTPKLWMEHGCDGCCQCDDFPGKFRGNGLEPPDGRMD